MSDKDEDKIDYDTLPSDASEIDGVDIKEEDEELNFPDDEDNSLFEDDVLNNDSDDDDEPVDDDSEGESEEAEEEDEDEGNSSGTFKTVALYTGFGVGAALGVFGYAKYVLGMDFFGSEEDAANQPTNEISRAAKALEGKKTSEISKQTDEFDTSKGWDKDGPSTVNTNSGKPDITQLGGSTSPGDQAEVGKSDGDTASLPLEKDPEGKESSGFEEIELIEDEPQFKDNQEDTSNSSLKATVYDVIHEAITGLATKKDIDKQTKVIVNKVEKSLGNNLSSIKSAIKDIDVESVSKKHRLSATDKNRLISNRYRIPNLSVISGSSDGDISIILNSSKKTNALEVGDVISTPYGTKEITGVKDEGMLILVGEKYYIDETRVVSQVKISKSKPSKTEASKSAPAPVSVKSAKSKQDAYRLSKERAQNKARDFASNRINLNRLTEEAARNALSKKGLKVTKLESPENKKDYVLAPRPIDQGGITSQPLPNNHSLQVARGWKGNMIMGDTFIIRDPDGSWLRLRVGDRVPEFNNDLVHGLDDKKNLIIGNKVVLFN